MSEVTIRRRENTRQRLLDAAFAVFVRHGFAGATIEMITDEAGFTRGAFYSNFTSKDELFIELLSGEFQKRLDTALATLSELDLFQEDALDPRSVGEIVGSTLADRDAERDWQILQTEFDLYTLRNPHVTEAANLIRNYTERTVEALMPQLDRLGVRIIEDPAPLIRTIMSAYMSITRSTFLNPELEHDEAVAQQQQFAAQQMAWFTTVLDGMVEPAE